MSYRNVTHRPGATGRTHGRDIAAFCEKGKSMRAGPTFVSERLMDYRTADGAPYFEPLVASLVMSYRKESMK